MQIYDALPLNPPTFRSGYFNHAYDGFINWNGKNARDQPNKTNPSMKCGLQKEKEIHLKPILDKAGTNFSTT